MDKEDHHSALQRQWATVVTSPDDDGANAY